MILQKELKKRFKTGGLSDSRKKMTKYTIIIEEADGNFSAYCPDLPGCVATGKTMEETIQRMKAAIKFHLEGLKAEKMAIPEPSTHVTSIDVTI